jgi:hypothetical protein
MLKLTMSISWESFKKIASSSYKVRISYTDKSGNKTTRIISPIKALEYGANDYLEAYCHTREDRRKFILSSISSFEILDELKKINAPINAPIESGFVSINNTTKVNLEPKGYRPNDAQIERFFTFTAKALLYIIFLPIVALLSGGSRRSSRGSGISTSFSRRAARDYYHRTKSVSSCYKSEW